MLHAVFSISLEAVTMHFDKIALPNLSTPEIHSD